LSSIHRWQGEIACSLLQSGRSKSCAAALPFFTIGVFRGIEGTFELTINISFFIDPLAPTCPFRSSLLSDELVTESNG